MYRSVPVVGGGPSPHGTRSLKKLSSSETTVCVEVSKRPVSGRKTLAEKRGRMRTTAMVAVSHLGRKWVKRRTKNS